MGSRLSSTGWGGPHLGSVEHIPAFLGCFFSTGRSAPGRWVEIGEGLWDLLAYCWRLSPRQREQSQLCRKLILAPDLGWREEADVVEAMARSNHPHNPARLATDAVAGFAGAFLAEGEAVRGRRARQEVHLHFLLPRLDGHPVFSADDICAALRAGGTPDGEVRAHLDAVHPARTPYTGTWILRLEDRLKAVPGPGAPGEPSPGHAIHLEDPALGARSRVSLFLAHPPDLAGYFQLSLQPRRGEAAALPAQGSE